MSVTNGPLYIGPRFDTPGLGFITLPSLRRQEPVFFIQGAFMRKIQGTPASRSGNPVAKRMRPVRRKRKLVSGRKEPAIRQGSLARLILLLLGLGGALAAPAGGQERTARGRSFMVAAPTPEAMEAGRAMLEAGGNAVDAAAAAAFALWVTDPQMSSVGGRAQILVRLADGTVVGIDGATQAPLRVDEPANRGHGYQTAPIPGSPAALDEMLRRFGTVSLETALQPAIRLAEEGVSLPPDVHDALRSYRLQLTRYPGTRAHFYKADGSPYREGEVFRQPALARTLRILAREGTRALYHGSLAQAVVADMEEHGGLIRLDDLEGYEPEEGPVVRGSYRNYEIVSRGGNCDGASVIEMLQILEHFQLADYDPADPEYIHILAQALYIGGLDEYVSDWIQVSKAHAARRVREIDLHRALPVPVRDPGASRAPSVTVGDSGAPRTLHVPAPDPGTPPARGPSLPAPDVPGGDTNHVSVVDAAGNAVSITQSIGPRFGSKVVNPELGFFYAYSYDMNDDPVPGQREKTEQSPTMLLKDGGPFLVLGSAGSARIPGSIVATTVNVIDHGMSLEEALAAPRWFLMGGELRIEASHLSHPVLETLEGLGYTLSAYDGLDGYFAKVHAVLVDPATGELRGGSDPRDLGAAGGG